MSAVFPNAIPLKMAIVAINKNKLNDTPAAPCGECRQALFEWEKRNKTAITLFLQGEKGKILHVKTVSDLLPFAFSKEDLI